MIMMKEMRARQHDIFLRHYQPVLHPLSSSPPPERRRCKCRFQRILLQLLLALLIGNVVKNAMNNTSLTTITQIPGRLFTSLSFIRRTMMTAMLRTRLFPLADLDRNVSVSHNNSIQLPHHHQSEQPLQSLQSSSSSSSSTSPSSSSTNNNVSNPATTTTTSTTISSHKNIAADDAMTTALEEIRHRDIPPSSTKDDTYTSTSTTFVITIFAPSRGDRSGTAILDMLKAHAFVWSLAQQFQQQQYQQQQHPKTQQGRNIVVRFGGACGVSYFANDYVRLIRILGLQQELPYNPPSCPPLPIVPMNDIITNSSSSSSIGGSSNSSNSNITLLLRSRRLSLEEVEETDASLESNRSESLFSNSKSAMAIQRNMNDAMQRNHNTTSNSVSMFLSEVEYQSFELIRDPHWLLYLQQQRQPHRMMTGIRWPPLRPGPPNPKRPLSSPQHVVIHVRRGDVSPCYSYRYLPNSYYLSLLDLYAPFLEKSSSTTTIHKSLSSSTTSSTSKMTTTTPMHRVTIFTESPEDPSRDEGLQDFVDRGMTLITCHANHTRNHETLSHHHHDNNSIRQSSLCYDPMLASASSSDPLSSSSSHTIPDATILVDADMEVIWNTMLHNATILILSKSLFSYVPAMFSNAHTIVYAPRFFYRPLAHWSEVPRRLYRAANKDLRIQTKKYCTT